MSVLRGKGRGLELVFTDRPFEAARMELQTRLSERATFYSGSAATAVFGVDRPSPEQLSELRTMLEAAGVSLVALSGPPEIEGVAAQAGLGFSLRAAVTPGEELVRRRANRPKRSAVQLSEAARSLAADFAGARADLAARRIAGPIRQFTPAPAKVADVAIALTAAQPALETHYHVGTVRGGQSLHHVGNLVVMGDVNPGSELVASGDIVVFGSLRGVAHAGAQGDVKARVYALELAATQLRIATFIAADDAHRKRSTIAPEVACVLDGRITILGHDKAQQLSREGVN